MKFRKVKDLSIVENLIQEYGATVSINEMIALDEISRRFSEPEVYLRAILDYHKILNMVQEERREQEQRNREIRIAQKEREF